VNGSFFVSSPDGTQVAYDQCGTGPGIILLHGGGVTRQDWHATGYVQRLQDSFSVVTMDLRGHGESDRPTDPSKYTTAKMGQDILAVADACGIEQFALWGMSYGGKVGRYLAIQSERVSSLVIIGTPMGPGVSGERRQQALVFLAHWRPIVQAQQAGTLVPSTLSESDREILSRLHVPSMLGWVRAMLDWPAVEPAHFRCPTLWLIGSEDRHAMDSLRAYRQALRGSKVQVYLADGLDHDQAFDEIDKVFPTMLAFTQAAQ
jgi:pimeloyl-ACP methyl ester carboxylesterase